MFDPFENRASRDIRNLLSEYFLETLRDGNRPRFDRQAPALKKKAPDPDHLDFIDDRIRRYHTVFTALNLGKDSGPPHEDEFHIAAQLWSGSLFFECHEWLEEFWIAARGPEKKAIQALIRSAGALVLFEAGRTKPAGSSARKACALLQEAGSHIPAPFDPGQLISALESIVEPNVS